MQPSLSGKRFMITFIDDYSRFVWLYFMHQKSEAFEKFKDFKLEVERLTGREIKVLRSDNGGEYMSHEFSNFLKTNEIGRRLTCSNTPQQNGISERKNRHLAEVSGSMLHDKNVPGSYWAESMMTAAYVINRLPQQGLEYRSPYERLFGKKPSVRHLKVFGCMCYVFIPSHLRHQLS